MVAADTLLKKIASVNNSVINSYDLTQNKFGEDVLSINLRLDKNHSNRCPHCGAKCPIYDRSTYPRKWRALDAGGIIVELYSKTVRVCCPEHGVVTAAVPWAFHDSGFTKDFDMMSTYFALNINRSIASQIMRCGWHTIMRCISRVKKYLEPDSSVRYEGLVNIGIDETSYRKGHKYITTVVNQDTNTIVWCAEGHSTETLSQFFELLTPTQRASIKNVSGDGAKWIDACIKKYIPQATRCIDAFHVVSWANESMDELRKQAWHEANKEVKAIESSTNKRKKGRPRTDDKTSIKLSEAIRNATQIKGSTYSLGKAPEKLTNNQKQRLEYIAATQPKLFRGYKLKEQLRLVFKLDNIEDVKVELKDFFFKATHSRIDIFKELAYKIRRHEEHIFNTIETQLSNARIESMNNKIKLFIRKAYGFRNIQNMIDLIMLGCSNLHIPLPNRGRNMLKIA